MADNATTRPARKRTPAKKAAAAPTPKATTTASTTATVADEGGTTRTTFAMNMGDDTKTYRKFTPPADSGCVGTIYVPHGTLEVRVLLVMPAAAE